MIAKPNLTNGGTSLLIRAIGGETITFTRFKIGSGELPAGMDTATLTDLIHEDYAFELTGLDLSEPGQATFEGQFDSSQIAVGFAWRELGLYCKGEDGVEHLYAYCNYGDDAGTLLPQADYAMTIQTISFVVLVGEAEHITALVAPSKAYASKLHTHSVGDIAKCGSFTGDGTVKRLISLDFTPSAVFICTDQGDIDDGVSGGLALAGAGLRSAASTNTSHAAVWNASYTALMITSNGFWVNYQSGSIATNKSGVVYHYIAYR